MAVKIRLRRMGSRGRAFYRVVVADSRSPRDGRFIEAIGYYDPRKDPPEIKINGDRARLWLSRGAQPTDTAAALLKKEGILLISSPSKEAATVAEPGEKVDTGQAIEQGSVTEEAAEVTSEATTEQANKPRTTRKKTEEKASVAESVPTEVGETAIQSETGEAEQTAE